MSINSLEKLRIADPDTYVWVRGRVEMLSPPPSAAALAMLADETIWGLAEESGVGAAVARGLLQLMSDGDAVHRDTYVQRVRDAARTGATLARIVATFLAPVLRHDPGLLDRFEATLAIMMGKGSYTLATPMETLSRLLSGKDRPSASAYLDLLDATFSQALSYNQSLRLVYLLPKAVDGFSPARRESQIRQLCALVKVDLQLVEPFLDGLEKGVGLLDPTALAQFSASALNMYRRSPEAAIKFLSLTSQVGLDASAALQRAVTLTQVQAQLNRYLQARMGHALAVRPMTESSALADTGSLAASDGRHIFLPQELDRFEVQADNVRLYKMLARLEAGFFECGSFDFDLDRAADRHPDVIPQNPLPSDEAAALRMCDGERFIRSFPIPGLADDLFNLYEQARVAGILKKRYPGMARQVLPWLEDEVRRYSGRNGANLLSPVAARLVMGLPMDLAGDSRDAVLQQDLIALFDPRGSEPMTVEDAAALAVRAYDRCLHHGRRKPASYTTYLFPYGRRLRWDLASLASNAQDVAALRIKMRLESQGVRVYRSDVKQRLMDGQGRLSAEDIAELVITVGGDETPADGVVDLSAFNLDDLLRQSGIDVAPQTGADGDVFQYPEWDHHLQDYLEGHTRVREIVPSGKANGDFYQKTLTRHGGLVSRMRRAFELLKPEGLALLRQWPEGDAFDYRALLDFAMDRRAGRIPSDRLFIKRLKQERDVAVLLLMDMSRSTANPVAGGHTTVLDLAKAAAVLFCEALEVVGDTYAIAGFSGSGRHAVDFHVIKQMGEPLGDRVRARLSDLSPQRSTRMGAAIRHAGAWLSKVQSRVRLLIVISDGFPNDLGYKADYAIADTRRAVLEARSRNFHVKAITVNIGSDPRLDDLYGRVNHHVIGDVRELPDKLLRLYGTLTRH